MSKRNNKHRYQSPVATVALEQRPPERRESPIKYILEQQKLRTRQDLLKLRLAVDSAENIVSYDREMLHDIYRECEKDPNLESNWESRKMKVKEKPFKVCDPGMDKENKKLTKVLEAPWFFDWVDSALDCKKWDFSLIEFGPLYHGEFIPYSVNGKYYDAITVIDRDNVKPELGIITNTPGQSTGLSFSDPKYASHLMFVGSLRSRKGFLWKAAKYILFKDNCLGNWSEWAEVFGMDKRVGYTDVDGDDRKKFLQALRDIGSNSYGVFGANDKVEYIGTQRTDAYKVYHEFVKYIDEQMAKLVFGQDVVSNNTGKVVGSVGENIANMYGDNDARFIEYLVNKRLFPMMENLGFSWKGHYFKWDTTEKVSLKDRAEIDAKISKDMGKKHSDEYINNTYGTNVITVEPAESADPAQVNQALRNMYA
jgi:phage gp29-like protein